MKNIIFVNSHPIQYFAPLYKYMNQQGVRTQAWYCSDESIKGGYDKQFGTEIKWDIPLLDGYEYRFFKNYSPNPSHFNGFFGLMNFGMIKALFKIPKSVIIVHGWHYFTLMMILLVAKLRGHTVCVRTETPESQEKLKLGWNQKVKKQFLKHFVFSRVHFFLYIGTQNLMFYKNYGIPDEQLIFCPYSVDNQRFRAESAKWNLLRESTRKELGIQPHQKVILFSGKYIEKKRPIDLLTAFHDLQDLSLFLIMVGEGELRKKMEEYIQNNNVQNVLLTGFVNQSAIAKFYSLSDLFVMCSSQGETWGLSVNEALNFGLPIVVSDLTGCSEDLVVEGRNGYIFKTGDVNNLTEQIQRALQIPFSAASASSLSLADTYSYITITKGLLSIADN